MYRSGSDWNFYLIVFIRKLDSWHIFFNSPQTHVIVLLYPSFFWMIYESINERYLMKQDKVRSGRSRFFQPDSFIQFHSFLVLSFDWKRLLFWKKFMIYYYNMRCSKFMYFTTSEKQSDPIYPQMNPGLGASRIENRSILVTSCHKSGLIGGYDHCLQGKTLI